MKVLKHIILAASASSLTGYALLQIEPEIAVSAYAPQLHYDTCSTFNYEAGASVGLTQITLAGEEVPLESRRVRTRVSREIAAHLENPQALNRLMRHSRVMFNQVQPILKKHGIPRDFRYVMMVESMGLETAMSRRGAAGLWQLMPDPARDLGLRVDNEVDERLHLEKATNAACRYIKQLHKETGSWTNALASYNVGVNRFMRKCTQAGHDDYYQLRLNQETNRYIYKLIALKELTERPAAYGLQAPKAHTPVLLATNRRVKVRKPLTSLSYFARQHHTTVAQIKARNPWLVGGRLVPKTGQEITLLMPPLPQVLRSSASVASAPAQDFMLAMGIEPAGRL